MVFSCIVYLFLFIGMLQKRQIAELEARQQEEEQRRQNQMYGYILFYIY
jgi:hypothetical protein